MTDLDPDCDLSALASFDPSEATARTKGEETTKPLTPQERGRLGGIKSGEARRTSTHTVDLPDEAETDPADTIRLMMSVQRLIALGKTKPKPAPAQQTAAAKAWGELRIQLQQLQHASDAKTFDLAQLTDRLDVLRVVVEAGEAELAQLRESMGEWGWL